MDFCCCALQTTRVPDAGDLQPLLGDPCLLLFQSFSPTAGKSLSSSAVAYKPDQLPPENSSFLERSFVCRFRCLLDNSSGFLVSTDLCRDLCSRRGCRLTPWDLCHCWSIKIGLERPSAPAMCRSCLLQTGDISAVFHTFDLYLQLLCILF